MCFHGKGACLSLQCTNLLAAVQENGLLSLAGAVGGVLVCFSCYCHAHCRQPSCLFFSCFQPSQAQSWPALALQTGNCPGAQSRHLVG